MRLGESQVASGQDWAEASADGLRDSGRGQQAPRKSGSRSLEVIVERPTRGFYVDLRLHFFWSRLGKCLVSFRGPVEATVL